MRKTTKKRTYKVREDKRRKGRPYAVVVSCPCNPNNGLPFYNPGASFDKTGYHATLKSGSWPVGIVFKINQEIFAVLAGGKTKKLTGT